jgi:hypothetical protein
LCDPGRVEEINVNLQIIDPKESADQLINTLLSGAPVNFEKLVDGASSADLGRAISALDAIIEKSARIRGYLDGRYGHGCGDQGHKDSVKSSNKLVNKIRKALGFTFPGTDLSF